VPETPTIAVNAPALLTPPAGPNWDEVPFDVGCPRCGQDLRGTSEPRCAGCSLALDWDKLIPLDELSCAECRYQLRGLSELRCPECGERFTWDGALQNAMRRRLPLFEYHCFKRPIRAYLANLWLAIRPRRMWRVLDIQDRPNAPGLIILLAITATLLVVGLPLFMVVMRPLLVTSMEETALAMTGGRYPAFQGGRQTFHLVSLIPYQPLDFLVVGAILCAIWFSVLLGLLLLRQSMRVCRIRFVQVFRVWVLAIMPLPLCLMMGLVAIGLVDVGMLLNDLNENAALYGGVPVWWARWPNLAKLPNILVIVVASLPLVSLAFGYRRYLRMPHAWGVALAAGIIGVMLPPAVIVLGVQISRVLSRN
jgi:hypothetical protein